NSRPSCTQILSKPVVQYLGTTSLSNRPELRELRWQRREAEVDLALGRNQMLPGLNAAFESSQDVGRAASSKRDKSPFELEAGILLDVPLQRRKARGKIMESQGKIAQLMAKQRFTEDKIAIQVRDAVSALATTYDRILRARENARLARELEVAERLRFNAGASDLLRVALQEGSAIEALLLEIDALSDYFKSQAAFEAAVATDPLVSL
ncbi:MAG: TolC family protein, partial [Planctomycetota bacterium]|nr:TolC family protein [Planctomycetota bacterium]